MRWIPLIALLLTNLAFADRGLSVKYMESEAANAPVAGEMQLYSNSHALVIGIDNYNQGWPRLSQAVKDAKNVAAALEQKGFNVTLLTDLNGLISCLCKGQHFFKCDFKTTFMIVIPSFINRFR